MTHVTQERSAAARREQASVRTAGPADALAVGTVQAASWREAYAGRLGAAVLASFEPHALAAVWRQSLEQPPTPNHRLLVACAGDVVVGLAAIGPCPDPDADERVSELLVLGVHPHARRAGHGSRLLHAAAQTARESGATVLATWVPRDDEATREFLQRAGLVPDSAWRDRGIDDAGHRVREVRLVASLTGVASQSLEQLAPTPPGKD